MKILSWNVCDTNPNATRIHDCLEKTQPDVVILQEALSPHIDVLKKRYSKVAIARDSVYGEIKSFLVIASNRELSNVSVVTHYPGIKKKPSILAKLSRLDQFLDTLSADITDDNEQTVRFVNMHTSAYASPSVRRDEIECSMKHISATGPCIIAGDFNSYANPTMSWIVALPLGFGFKDLMCREVIALKTGFAARGFDPSISGVTYSRFGFELDQVFRRSAPVKSAVICNDLWGSDHCPILIELA